MQKMLTITQTENWPSSFILLNDPVLYDEPCSIYCPQYNALLFVHFFQQRLISTFYCNMIEDRSPSKVSFIFVCVSIFFDRDSQPSAAYLHSNQTMIIMFHANSLMKTTHRNDIIYSLDACRLNTANGQCVQCTV